MVLFLRFSDKKNQFWGKKFTKNTPLTILQKSHVDVIVHKITVRLFQWGISQMCTCVLQKKQCRCDFIFWKHFTHCTLCACDLLQGRGVENTAACKVPQCCVILAVQNAGQFEEATGSTKTGEAPAMVSLPCEGWATDTSPKEWVVQRARG